jgi:hypothetical protein
MKVGNDAKSLIGNAYPGYDEIIELGFREYPAFRDLCEDYRSCAVALDGWRRPGSAAYEERTNEYEELLADLAREIEGWLASLSRADRLGTEEEASGKSS